MPTTVLIDDGYTRHSTLKGRERMYPDLTFRWRPTTILMRAKFAGATKQVGMSAERLERMGAEILAKQLLEWSAVNHQGQPAPINADSVLKLHPDLFNRLYAVVVNMSTPPDVDHDEQSDMSEALVAATGEGLSLDEYLEKNS